MTTPPTGQRRAGGSSTRPEAAVPAHNQDPALSNSNETFRRFAGGNQPAWLTGQVPPNHGQENLAGGLAQSRSPITTKKHARSGAMMGYATSIVDYETPLHLGLTSNASRVQSKRPRSRASISDHSQSIVGLDTYHREVNVTHANTTPDITTGLAPTLWTGSPTVMTPMPARTDTPMTDASSHAPSPAITNNPFAVSQGSPRMLENSSTPGSSNFSHSRTNSAHSRRHSSTALTPKSILQPMTHYLPQQHSLVNNSPRLENMSQHVPALSTYADGSREHTLQHENLSGSQMLTDATAQPQTPSFSQLLMQDNCNNLLGTRPLSTEETALVRFFSHSTPQKSNPYAPGIIETHFGQLQHKLERLHMTPIVQGRRLALQQAIERRDQLFVVLHQLMCQYASTKTFPPGMNYQGAIVFMHILLGDQEMSPDILVQFRDFPHPLGSFIRDYPQLFKYWVSHLQMMFSKIETGWQRLEAECISRRYPPTVKEMLLVMGIPSVEIMECYVNLMCRKIWKPDDELVDQFLDKAKMVFRNNINAMRARGSDLEAIINLDERPFRHEYERLVWDLTNTRQQFNIQQLHYQRQQMALQAGNGQISQPNYAVVPTLQHSVVHQQGAVSGPHHTVPSQPTYRQVTPNQGIFYSTTAQVSPIPATVGAGSPQEAVSRRSSMVMHSLAAYGRVAATLPQARTLGSSSFLPTGSGRFYPASGVKISQPRVPIPERMAIHQAHLIEPPIRVLLSGQPTILTHFQFVGDIRKVAYELHSNIVYHHILFDLNQEECKKLPRMGSPVSLLGSGIQIRDLQPDSVQYRVRCFRKGKENKTEFPQWLALKLNEKVLGKRQKLHYGTDLPIDITHLVRQGRNDLVASMLVKTGDPRANGWTVVVETILLTTEAEIKNWVTSKALTEPEVIAAMVSNLNPPETEDDDEIMIVNESLRIPVADPLSATLIGELPVRTKDCKHSDCFSLETFLMSRPRVPKKINDPNKLFGILEAVISEADKWACPMRNCLANASPGNLRLDLWMKKVQAQLVGKEDGQYCMVVVEKDGSWKIQPSKKG
jgi:hypothetical protein